MFGGGERSSFDSPPGVGFDQLFFIVGRGKSGTSWLMGTLDAHPQLVCRGEGRFFGVDHGERDNVALTLSSLLWGSPELKQWLGESAWTRAGDSEDELAGATGALVAATMGRELRRSGAKLVGDKTTLLSETVVSEIAAACPGARVIHIVRDGRDVMISSMHHMWNADRRRGDGAGIDPRQAELRDRYRADPKAFLASGASIFNMGLLDRKASQWARVTTATRALGSRLGELYTEVRYEDLLTDGPREIARLLGFLGVEATEGIARECLEATSFSALTGGRSPGEEDSTAFMRKGIAGDWRGVFNEANRETFKQCAGEALIEFGYEQDERW